MRNPRIDPRRAALGALAAGAGALALRYAVRRARRFDFQGGRVLITGGSRGLGLLMARRLVADGALVAICAPDAGEVRRAERELRRRGGTVLGLTCDIRDADQLAATIEAVRAAWGGIDVLVNNAASCRWGPAKR